MKKNIVFLLLFCLLVSLCSCTQQQIEPTDAVSESTSESVTHADDSVSSATDPETQPTDAVTTQTDSVSTTENTTNNTDVTTGGEQSSDSLFENATIPAVENYTLQADEVKAKDGFVFKGEKKTTQICNKIVFSTSDGIMQVSFSFAPDGSKMRVLTEDPTGTRTQSIISFNENGDIFDITNGSGQFSNYFYRDNLVEMLAYDASGNLIDKRIYHKNANDQVEYVERSDAEGSVETYKYTLGENGLAQSLRIENETGYLLYEYTYDEYDRLICTRIEENNQFYAKQLYTYDEHNNKASYTIRNLDAGIHESDVTVLYNNVYANDGTYLGTSEVDSVSGEVYISVAYGYGETEYPHYAEFVEDHYATY